jgi:hypothetical protein
MAPQFNVRPKYRLGERDKILKELAHRHGTHFQGLISSESQKLAGELSAALARLSGSPGARFDGIFFGHHANELKAGHHDTEDVVEIVSDSAGEAAQRFQLLGLDDGAASALPLHDLGRKAIVRVAQLLRALADALFEMRV